MLYQGVVLVCSITLGPALVNTLAHHQNPPIALPYIPPFFSASRCRFSENWIIAEGGYPLDTSRFFQHLLSGGLAPEFAFFAGLFEFVFRRHESDVSNSGDTILNSCAPLAEPRQVPLTSSPVLRKSPIECRRDACATVRPKRFCKRLVRLDASSTSSNVAGLPFP